MTARLPIYKMLINVGQLTKYGGIWIADYVFGCRIYGRVASRRLNDPLIELHHSLRLTSETD